MLFLSWVLLYRSTYPLTVVVLNRAGSQTRTRSPEPPKKYRPKNDRPTGATLFQMRRTRSESGSSLRTLAPIAPDRSASTSSTSPSPHLMLTSSGLQPMTAQTLRPPWTGSPAPVDRVARSACLSGTRTRKTTVLLLPPGGRAVSSASTRRCHLPFGMQPAIALNHHAFKVGGPLHHRACGNQVG